jgi:hypothetical protein
MAALLNKSHTHTHKTDWQNFPGLQILPEISIQIFTFNEISVPKYEKLSTYSKFYLLSNDFNAQI